MHSIIFNTENVAEALLDLFENELLLGIKSSDEDDIWEIHPISPHKPKMEKFIAKSFIPSYQELIKALKHKEFYSTSGNAIAPS